MHENTKVWIGYHHLSIKLEKNGMQNILTLGGDYNLIDEKQKC